jgi:hypothetical protein
LDVQWHIAFCNVTYTEYAGVTYRDYYGSPAAMLEAQLTAKEHAERRWGAGQFITPNVDSPGCTFATLLGMSVLEPADADEIPYLDSTRPVITDVAQADQIVLGDPRATGLMARRWEACQYYTEHGYPPSLAGGGSEIITAAVEISGEAVLRGFAENPEGAWRVLDKVIEAEVALATFDLAQRGVTYTGTGYVGDDYAGLLSPAMYREFALPCYERLYGANENRFMHSELLRAEHLRISREELGVTMFHGAGCMLLTLAEMYAIMGENFWTQLTPQELLEMSPRQIDERIREFAGCGCSYVQLYPGRGTPEANMDAAVAACRRECPGGP